MRVIVCGGRDYRNIAFVWMTLDKLHAATPFTALMQGGQTGVDTFAKEWARTIPELKDARFVCKAEWTKYGPAAGPIRNKKMLDWKPDCVIAFAGGPGTNNMIRQARSRGIRVIDVGAGDQTRTGDHGLEARCFSR